MKIMKKLMALVLASALALTLLTGCGGGGGSTVVVVPGGDSGTGGSGTVELPDLSGKSYTVNGRTVTIGSANNANTEFSQLFMATFSYGANVKLSYSTEKGRKSQKFIDESIKQMMSNPNADSDVISLLALQNAGIDTKQEMIFVTDKVSSKDQAIDIIDQMAAFEKSLGRGINPDGKTFGYTTLNGKDNTGANITGLYVIVGYTLV